MSTKVFPAQGVTKSQHNYLLPSCHFPLCREAKPRLLFCNPARRSCNKQQNIVPPKIPYYFPRYLTAFSFRFFLTLSETPERAPCSDSSLWPWVRWLSDCFFMVTCLKLWKDTGPQPENLLGTHQVGYLCPAPQTSMQKSAQLPRFASDEGPSLNLLLFYCCY